MFDCPRARRPQLSSQSSSQSWVVRQAHSEVLGLSSPDLALGFPALPESCFGFAPMSSASFGCLSLHGVERQSLLELPCWF